MLKSWLFISDYINGLLIGPARQEVLLLSLGFPGVETVRCNSDVGAAKSEQM